MYSAVVREKGATLTNDRKDLNFLNDLLRENGDPTEGLGTYGNNINKKA